MSKKILAKKNIFIIASLFGLIVLFVPLLVKAGIIDGIVEGAIFMVLGVILQFILAVLGWLLTISGMILDMILGSALQVQNTNAVSSGWALARDVANMFFIIFLLFIAFGTIFRLETYQYKALLPKLILGILLVNFSRTIATIFIEFSNLLTAAFLNFDPGRSATSALLALAGVDDVTDLPEAAGVDGATIEFDVLVGLAAIVFIVGLLVVAVGGFAGMLVIRTIALLVLIVLSPIAFALGILPATKEVYDQWWKKFLQYIMYTPLAALCLYLAMKVASEVQSGKQFIGMGNNLQGPTQGESLRVGAQKATVIVGLGGDAASFYQFSLIIGLLLASIVFVQQVGGALAGWLMGAAKMGMLGLGAFFGKGALRRVNRFMASRGKEGGLAQRMGRRLGAMLEARGIISAGGSERWGKGFRKAAQASRLLSPTVVKEAWGARQKEADRRAFGESIGWAHNFLNRVFLDRDQSDYERLRQGEEVRAEEGRLAEANPALGHAFLREEGAAAIKANDLNKVEAVFRLAVKMNNWNEIVRDLGRMPELRGLFHSQGWLDTNRGREGAFDHDSRQDMLDHIFGRERGNLLMLEFGENGKSRGDFSSTEAMDYIAGKFVRRDPRTRSFAAASEWGKLSTDKSMQLHRLDLANVHYDADGNEIVDDLTDVFESQVLFKGFTSEQIKRSLRVMPKDAQERLLQLDDQGKLLDLQRRIPDLAREYGRVLNRPAQELEELFNRHHNSLTRLIGNIRKGEEGTAPSA